VPAEVAAAIASRPRQSRRQAGWGIVLASTFWQGIEFQAGTHFSGARLVFIVALGDRKIGERLCNVYTVSVPPAPRRP
jgi:hypothetical protein